MTLTLEKKREVIKSYRQNKKDTGSCEVQIALQTARINELTEHCAHHPKDRHSRYGLIQLVGKRKRLLSYLKRVSSDRYRELIRRLDLRK